MNEIGNFWAGFPLVHSDPEIRAGEPVLKGTRLTADALVENVEAFIELRGMSEDEAVEATFKQFPGIPAVPRPSASFLRIEIPILTNPSLEDSPEGSMGWLLCTCKTDREQP